MVEILALIIVIWLIKGFIFGWEETNTNPEWEWDEKAQRYVNPDSRYG